MTTEDETNNTITAAAELLTTTRIHEQSRVPIDDATRLVPIDDATRNASSAQTHSLFAMFYFLFFIVIEICIRNFECARVFSERFCDILKNAQRDA